MSTDALSPFETVTPSSPEDQDQQVADDQDKQSKLKARGWLLTLPASDYSEEFIKDKLQKYSYIGQLEQGKNGSDKYPDGYLHFQVYIEAENAILFSTLKRKFPKGHFEIRRGTVKQAYDYCSKSDTRISETFRNGDLLSFFEKSLKLQDFIALLLEGASVSDIMAAHPSAIVHVRHLEQLEAYNRRNTAIQGPRDLQVHYIWGKSGVGKTKGIYDKHGYEDVYRVSDYLHGFDNYDGQPVLVLDEFRSQFTVSMMLNLLDPYPLQLPARYANKWASFTTVYVISNIPIEHQYPNVHEEEPETHHAFVQRFDSISELTGINHRARIRAEVAEAEEFELI